MLPSPGGQGVLPVSLFQAIAAIPILALIPLLALAPGEAASGGAGWQALKAFGMVLGLVLGGRWLLQPALRWIARSRSGLAAGPGRVPPRAGNRPLALQRPAAGLVLYGHGHEHRSGRGGPGATAGGRAGAGLRADQGCRAVGDGAPALSKQGRQQLETLWAVQREAERRQRGTWSD